jgi:rod shape-determining protein MreD
MKPLLYTLAAVVLYAVNTVLPQPFTGSVNLLLLFTVCAALSDDGSSFLWAAFISGLLLDASSGLAFGSYTVAFLLTALLIRYATQTAFTADFSLGTLAGAVAGSYFFTVAVLYAASLVAARYSATPALSPLFVTRKIWIDLALDLLLAYPVYALVRVIDQFVERHNQKKKVML